MEGGIYFRAGSKSDYASVDMLPNGEDIPRIVIDRIEFHDEAISINGRTEKGVWLAHFAPNPFGTKPMVLNATNRRRIAKAHWHDRMEDGSENQGMINLLRGIPVRLTKEMARDVSNGGMTYGLRISQVAAATEAEMDAWLVQHGYREAPRRKTLPADKVQAVAEWAKSKGKTMADIEAAYDMDEDVRKAMKEALEG